MFEPDAPAGHSLTPAISLETPRACSETCHTPHNTAMLACGNDEPVPGSPTRVGSALLRSKPARSVVRVFLNDVCDARLDFLAIDVIGIGREHRLLTG